FPQWRATLPLQIFRQRFERILPQPDAQFGQWRVEPPAQRERWNAIGHGAVAFPDDVQNHLRKSGIAVMPVRAPASRAQVNLHVSAPRRLVANPGHRTAEIRPGFMIFETGMKYPHRTAVKCGEL